MIIVLSLLGGVATFVGAFCMYVAVQEHDGLHTLSPLEINHFELMSMLAFVIMTLCLVGISLTTQLRRRTLP